MSVTLGAAFFSFFSGPAKKLLNIGDTAPDFALTDQDGKNFVLHEEKGKNLLVIYFYPKDETPGCTKEACGFRDNYEAFTDAGAKVIGINAASAETHKKFAVHHRLPFTLLSDPGNKVGALFGVKAMFGMSARETYIIDKSGKIVFRFASMMQFDKHVSEALAVIKAQQEV